ncbi:terminase large subunit domain-containing protein, partial [Escherichia coli]
MIPVWSTACPDWAERLKKGLSIIPAPIYPDQAAHALAIFKQLRIVDAPGSPTFGESCAPWVFDLVAALFGSYDAQTGVRHIKEVFILIPKKNSKSTLAAGIMMTALLLNWRQAAGYTILAPTVEVAANAFNPARDVRDGKIHDPHFLPVIFEHPPEMVESGANLLMENLAMVNPNLGYSVDEAFLYREYRKAREAGEETFRGFMSKHANVEIGLALRSDRWAGADFWEEQGRCISLDDIL